MSKGSTGGRGTGWVVAQTVVMTAAVVVLAVGPVRVESTAVRAVGIAVLSLGALFAGWALGTLGRDLTPFTTPPPGAKLVESGPFAIVRHPVYGGGLGVFTGLSIGFDLAALALTAALALVWLGKTREEEERLRERFDGYAAYMKRVRWRFVPYLL